MEVHLSMATRQGCCPDIRLSGVQIIKSTTEDSADIPTGTRTRKCSIMQQTLDLEDLTLTCL